MKLIIDIPDNIYDAIKEAQTIISGQRSGKTLLQILVNSVENGTPLDDVKAEIANLDRHKENYSCVFNRPDLIDLVVGDVLHILDNIGKAESEDT